MRCIARRKALHSQLCPQGCFGPLARKQGLLVHFRWRRGRVQGAHDHKGASPRPGRGGPPFGTDGFTLCSARGVLCSYPLGGVVGSSRLGEDAINAPQTFCGRVVIGQLPPSGLIPSRGVSWSCRFRLAAKPVSSLAPPACRGSGVSCDLVPDRGWCMHGYAGKSVVPW